MAPSQKGGYFTDPPHIERLWRGVDFRNGIVNLSGSLTTASLSTGTLSTASLTTASLSIGSLSTSSF